MHDSADRPVLHRVRASGHGLPLLDYLLKTLTTVPEQDVRDAVQAGQFRLQGGETLATDSLLEAGTVLEADVPEKAYRHPLDPPLPASIDELYCDEHLIAIHKPPGLLSHPLGPQKLAASSLAEAQLARRGEPGTLRPLHRLDRETSGVLLLARTENADRAIKGAFQRRAIRKRYLCIVRGQLEGGIHRVEEPISRDLQGPIRVRMQVDPDGAPCRTDFEALGSFGDKDWGEAGPGYSWVEARPETGRTHQIRVHLAHLGHPVVGDKLYIDEGRAFLRRWDGRLDEADLEALGMRRQALHAWSLLLAHPEDSRPLDFSAPVPADMLEFAAARGGRCPVPANSRGRTP